MTICIWPDGVWCHFDKVEQYTHKSDDYETVEAPLVCDEMLDVWVMDRM